LFSKDIFLVIFFLHGLYLPARTVTINNLHLEYLSIINDM